MVSLHSVELNIMEAESIVLKWMVNQQLEKNVLTVKIHIIGHNKKLNVFDALLGGA